MTRALLLLIAAGFFKSSWGTPANPPAPASLSVSTGEVSETCTLAPFVYLNHVFYRCPGTRGLPPGLLAVSGDPATPPVRYEVDRDGRFRMRTPEKAHSDGVLRLAVAASSARRIPAQRLGELREHASRLRSVLGNLERGSGEEREVRRLLDAVRADVEQLERRFQAPMLNMELGSGTRLSCRSANADAPLCDYYLCDDFVRDGKRCSSVLHVAPTTQFSPRVSTICDGELAAPESARISDTEVLAEHIPAREDPAHRLPQEFLPYLDVLRSRNDPLPEAERRACRSPALMERLKQQDAARAALIQRLNEQELVTWVQRLNNGGVTTSLIPRAMLPAGACRLEDGIFAQRGVSRSGILPSLGGEPMTLAEAEELMRSVLAMDDLPFDFVPDGCFARAEIIAQRLAARGVEVDKVWIQGGALGPAEAPGVQWLYHVAPSIRVRLPDGRIEHRVIDPSTRRSLMSVEEWARASTRGPLRPLMTTWPVPSSEWSDRPRVFFTPPEVFGPESGASVPSVSEGYSAEVRLREAWAALRQGRGLDEQGRISRQFSDRPLFVRRDGERYTVRMGRSESVYTIDATNGAAFACIVNHLRQGTSARLETRPGEVRITRCW